MSSLAVIVPTLGDTDAARQLLADIGPDSSIEVILVDGGGAQKKDAALEALVEARPGTRLIRTPPGRALQMNAGGSVASADWLLFLHADSRLPAGWRAAAAGVDSEAVGGWFRFALEDAAWQARVIERMVALRIRLLKLPYGDQGLLVRRDIFQRLGGFAQIPFLEDVEFVRRLVTTGPTVELPLPLRTSSRRWRSDGWFRRSTRNTAIVGLYLAGVSPMTLQRWYTGGRDRRRVQRARSGLRDL